MIFAHGPASFVLAYVSRNKWKFKLNKKQRIWIYIIAVISGLLPDIDLLFYYFFSAELSHRQMPTHSLALYLIIFLVFFGFAYLLKNNFLKIYSIVFFLATTMHLITDSIGYGVMWLYPYTNNIYGLITSSTIFESNISKYILALNYSMELLFIILMFILIVKQFIKSKQIFKIVLIFSAIIFVIGCSSLIYLNQKVFIARQLNLYADIDNDEIINKDDADIDGDGYLNVVDFDIDQNGQTNYYEMDQLISQNTGAYYDITEGQPLQIMMRMGFVTNADYIRRLFDNLGLNLRNLMSQDYINNSENYINSPKDQSFDYQPTNWQAYLAHNRSLYYNNKKNIKQYDILFFDNDYVALAYKFENDQWQVVEASFDHKKIIQTSLSELESRRGRVFKIGRLLPDENFIPSLISSTPLLLE